MSERIDTPFTNEHFASFCLSMLGQPYWYGTVVYKCTENLRSRKARQYPSHYGSSRTSRYRDDIAKKKVCADCVGLIKGYCWTGGGKGVIESIGTDKTFSSKYGGNSCPDKSANGLGDVLLSAQAVHSVHYIDWGVKLESFLPTATDDTLGTGKWVISPAMFAVLPVNENFFVAAGYKQYVSVAGDGGRQDLNYGRIRLLFSYMDDDQWWITFDPQYYVDYKKM